MLRASRGRTLQHRQVHGVVGFLRDAEHHFQAVLDLAFTFLTACQQLLRETDLNSMLINSTFTFPGGFAPFLLYSRTDALKRTLYFEKQLVLCDSLHWFDQVRGDGVSKAMPLLDFLQKAKPGEKKDVFKKKKKRNCCRSRQSSWRYRISRCEAKVATVKSGGNVHRSTLRRVPG